MEAVWPDTAVEENNLSVNVSILRKALGEANGEKYIETVPRRGYRFTAPVSEPSVESHELVLTRHTRSEILIEESQETDRTPPAILPRAPGRSRRLMNLALVLVLVLVSGVTVWIYFSRSASNTGSRSDAESSLRPVKMTLLTSFPGREEWPTFSPDGNQLAFMWSGEKGDNMDIYVKLTDTGAPLRLTTHPGLDNSPAWAPDGKYIAFTRFEKEESAIYIVPALGGAERRLLSLGFKSHWFGNYANVVWSPGGQSVAFPD